MQKYLLFSWFVIIFHNNLYTSTVLMINIEVQVRESIDCY